VSVVGVEEAVGGEVIVSADAEPAKISMIATTLARMPSATHRLITETDEAFIMSEF
jgi:hypothetical protein